MRLYIAGPMTGLPEFNYPAFNHAAALLQRAGYDTLNPVDIERHNDTSAPQAWGWYMRHAIRMVSEAEGVALLEGWRSSRGASLEVTIARALELPVRTVDAWLAAKAGNTEPVIDVSPGAFMEITTEDGGR